MEPNAIQRTQGAHLSWQQCDAMTAKAMEVSQVDEVLTQHSQLLAELSEELIRTRNRFHSVLLPELPANDAAAAAPAPMRSPLADAIVGQSHLVRSMLLDLRSINSRSTV